jgi:esterase/lipase superfamily enzyme
MLEKESGATRINLIAHSMGNLALMEVIRDLNLGREPANYRKVLFNQIVLAAPDIDRDLFLSLAQQIKGVAERVTLYASSNDLAMDASRTWAGSVPRAGDVPEGGPLVSPDVIDTIDASAISTSILALNHSGYAEDRLLLNDIGLLWRFGQPPGERSSILRPVPAEGQPRYWEFN